MEKPHTVHKAISLIWVLIALSVLIALINKWTGQIQSAEFVAYLVITAIYSIIPFKLNSRSNAARYFFVVLVALNALILLGGAVEGMSKLDLVFSIVTMPLYLFCAYLLFSKEASDWFLGNTTSTPERKEPTL